MAENLDSHAARELLHVDDHRMPFLRPGLPSPVVRKGLDQRHHLAPGRVMHAAQVRLDSPQELARCLSVGVNLMPGEYWGATVLVD